MRGIKRLLETISYEYILAMELKISKQQVRNGKFRFEFVTVMSRHGNEASTKYT